MKGLGVLLIFAFTVFHSQKAPVIGESIAVPAAQAKELRVLLDEAVSADRAADLAEQYCQARQWERIAKKNAWVAMQQKVARELKVPIEWPLNVDSMVFQPPVKAATPPN